MGQDTIVSPPHTHTLQIECLEVERLAIDADDLEEWMDDCALHSMRAWATTWAPAI